MHQGCNPIFATYLSCPGSLNMNKLNLLLELGTEELPPKALRKLAESLHENFVKHLNNEGLNFSQSKWYATPRRLALSLIHI